MLPKSYQITLIIRVTLCTVFVHSSVKSLRFLFGRTSFVSIKYFVYFDFLTVYQKSKKQRMSSTFVSIMTISLNATESIE